MRNWHPFPASNCVTKNTSPIKREKLDRCHFHAPSLPDPPGGIVILGCGTSPWCQKGDNHSLCIRFLYLGTISLCDLQLVHLLWEGESHNLYNESALGAWECTRMHESSPDQRSGIRGINLGLSNRRGNRDGYQVCIGHSGVTSYRTIVATNLLQTADPKEDWHTLWIVSSSARKHPMLLLEGLVSNQKISLFAWSKQVYMQWVPEAVYPLKNCRISLPVMSVDN